MKVGVIVIFSQCLGLFITVSLAYYLPLLAIDFSFKKKKALSCISAIFGLIMLIYVMRLPLINSKNAYDISLALATTLISLVVVYGIKFNIFKEQYKKLFKKMK